MKKICAITSTRADYGLLRPLLEKLEKNYQLTVLATGTHLSEDFGMTINEIDNNFYSNLITMNIIDASYEPSKIMRNVLNKFSPFFKENKFDLVVVLGDRFEIFAAVTAAFLENVPIAHLHGGEVTSGALDDGFRHSITKMSTLHFTSCETYRKRVIQLGEHPSTVFNVGAIGLDSIRELNLLSVDQLSKDLSIPLKPQQYLLGTFNPETKSKLSPIDQINIILSDIDKLKDETILFTYANIDSGGSAINNRLEEFSKNHNSFHVVKSLGHLRYLSALKECKAVVGNSSSGILEAPSFKVPTINIGNRQNGRIFAESIIQTSLAPGALLESLQSLTPQKNNHIFNTTKSPYGDGKASSQILEVFSTYKNEIPTEKIFYDNE